MNQEVGQVVGRHAFIQRSFVFHLCQKLATWSLLEMLILLACHAMFIMDISINRLFIFYSLCASIRDCRQLFEAIIVCLQFLARSKNLPLFYDSDFRGWRSHGTLKFLDYRTCFFFSLPPVLVRSIFTWKRFLGSRLSQLVSFSCFNYFQFNCSTATGMVQQYAHVDSIAGK